MKKVAPGMTAQGIEWTIRIERFSPADDVDGPAEGEDLTAHSPAVALRFQFNQGLIDMLKAILRSVHHSKMPWAGGWSKKSRCWWVRSTDWEQVRQALLDRGVELTGPLAHPGTKDGFFEREQTWDANRCEWR
jgi:hypothetical protein